MRNSHPTVRESTLPGAFGTLNCAVPGGSPGNSFSAIAYPPRLPLYSSAAMDIPPDQIPQTISPYGVGGRHNGYRLCPHCGASNSITQTALVKALEKGMKSQQFELVAKTNPPGTVAGMLAPLYKLFHDKGWKVRKI